MATDYSQFKVTELKEFLKERGIPSTGLSRKAQIIEALEKHDGEQTGVEADAAEQDGVAPEAADDVIEEGKPVEEDERDVVDEAPVTSQVDGDAVEMKVGVEAPNATVEAKETIATRDTEGDPLVLENNDPLSKEPSTLTTPQPSSPVAESISSETRKRKRRSPTPPPSQESVNKRLKAAKEEESFNVKLPEDGPVLDKAEEKIVEDAPVAVERTAESGVSEKILPFESSDDVMEIDAKRVPGESADGSAPVLESAEEPTARPRVGEEQDRTKEDGKPTTPAIHPATCGLYIRELVRPLQPAQLRSHLVLLATAPNASPSDSIVQSFHVDTIRTHAFVLFDSISAAARTRSALHSRIWPDEPTRKPLWADFIPEEKVNEWTETELKEEREGRRRGGKRWEVVYEEGDDGMVAKLVEVSSAMPAGPVRQAISASGGGMGMPNAPIGPRGNRQTPQAPMQPSTGLSKPSPTPAPSNSSFDVLDQRFSHTTSKPKLYFLTKPADLVQKRLDAMAAITSRRWDAEREGSFSISGDVRRYTFEDGEKVVDGGPDIGNFGRPRGMEIPPGRRGGRGGR